MIRNKKLPNDRYITDYKFRKLFERFLYQFLEPTRSDRTNIFKKKIHKRAIDKIKDPLPKLERNDIANLYNFFQFNGFQCLANFCNYAVDVNGYGKLIKKDKKYLSNFMRALSNDEPIDQLIPVSIIPILSNCNQQPQSLFESRVKTSLQNLSPLIYLVLFETKIDWINEQKWILVLLSDIANKAIKLIKERKEALGPIPIIRPTQARINNYKNFLRYFIFFFFYLFHLNVF